MAVATCATSRAWVRRVRWWSWGKTKTWVLPARRRNEVACRIRSRSRSKQVRHSSGSSVRARSPGPERPGGPGAKEAVLALFPGVAGERFGQAAGPTGPADGGAVSVPSWAKVAPGRSIRADGVGMGQADRARIAGHGRGPTHVALGGVAPMDLAHVMQSAASL